MKKTKQTAKREAAEQFDRELLAFQECTTAAFDAIMTSLAAISKEDAERLAVQQRSRATLH